MTLREKQSAFVLAVAKLIAHADECGYALTFGDAYRSPEEAKRLAKAGKGLADSLHISRLAVDFNLFIDGEYRTDTESHRPLGEWWESQSVPGLTYAWGGRFGDANHYSFAHAGKR